MTTRAQRRRKNLDVSPLLAAAILCIIGAAVVYSAVVAGGASDNYHLLQLQWLGIGIVGAMVAMAFQPRTLEGLAIPMYVAIIAVLILLLLLPGTTANTKRWIDLGPIGLQPSEPAKLVTVFMLARFLSDRRLDPNRASVVLQASVLGAVPMLLVLKQPDLGTSLVFPLIVLGMLYWRGLSGVQLFMLLSPGLSVITAFIYPPVLGEPDWIHMLPWATLMVAVTVVAIFSNTGLWRGLLAIAANIGVGLVTPFLWATLADYQKSRIITFLSPEADPRGGGYQIIQSKVAIGSGGWTGKGWLQGTQSSLDFLPERHTDFIVAVLGEEWGFLGVLLVLGLFFFIILKSIRFAREARHPFSSLTSFGLGTILTYHVFVNLGMATGLMPVTGLTLPLVSYGGTSLLMTMVLIGLLVGIGLRRHER